MRTTLGRRAYPSDLTDAQSDALTQMAGVLMHPALALSRARGAVTQVATDPHAGGLHVVTHARCSSISKLIRSGCSTAG